MKFTARLAVLLLKLVCTCCWLVSARASDAFPSFAWSNPLPEGGSLNSVIYANGAFMAGGIGGRILTSTDGTAWSPGATIPFEKINGLAFGASQYVAVGAGGQIYSSSTGASWTQRFVANNGWY